MLKDYGERTTRYIDAKRIEYQRMVAMLTETVSAAVHTNKRSIERLRDIENKLDKASVIEDVRILRMELGQCLEGVREEIHHHETEVAAAVMSLQASVNDQVAPVNHQDAPAVALRVHEPDPATGLPRRPMAEAALSEAAQQGGSHYVVAIVPNRIAAINTRFGLAVGDSVLRKISDQLKSRLPQDRIFRWSGPCFLALLARTTSEPAVLTEMTRITRNERDTLMHIKNRPVLLPLSLNCAVFPLNDPAWVIGEKVDQFVALQASKH
ncbi:MAG: diguanylate cyclase [Acidobacteriaceae bacterium]|nr:diguanylate cyclase [Acidobacteriaceae bacterium]